MPNPLIQPYLMFGGRCEEALEFYRSALGAQIDMLMRFSESPDPTPPGMLPPGFENKVMHASFRIGDNILMASDGCEEGQQFKGFSLSISVATEAEADRFFHRTLRRRPGTNAASQNILVTALRHAHRPLRHQLDGQCRHIRMRRMKSRISIIGGAMAALLAGTGCTTQQLYNTGQAWQRNECGRIMDQQERSRCLSSTSTSYEAYKQQSGTGSEPK